MTTPAEELRAAAARLTQPGAILRVHPAIGPPLAEWLEHETEIAKNADLWTDREPCAWCGSPDDHHALAVARAVLGQQPRETGQEAAGEPQAPSGDSQAATPAPEPADGRTAIPAEHCGQKAGVLPHPPHKFMRNARLYQCPGHDAPAAATELGTTHTGAKQTGDSLGTTAPDCNARDEPDSQHNPDLCTPTCWRIRGARYTTALIAAYTGSPTGRTDRMAVAAMDLADHEAAQLRAELERYTEAESADAAAGSYAHRAVQAEAVLARVRALRDTWDASGPPPLGTSMSRWWDRHLVALNGALAEPGPAATQATEQQAMRVYGIEMLGHIADEANEKVALLRDQIDNARTTCRITATLARDSEATVQRVIALHERWVKAGPPIGISMTGYFQWWREHLAELHDTILTPGEEQP